MTKPSEKQLESAGKIVRKQSLIANVIRTCECGSPGYWHNIPDSHNPETFKPERVTVFGSDHVGEFCPRCGRSTIAERTVLFSKNWIANTWLGALAYRIRSRVAIRAYHDTGIILDAKDRGRWAAPVQNSWVTLAARPYVGKLFVYGFVVPAVIVVAGLTWALKKMPDRRSKA